MAKYKPVITALFLVLLVLFFIKQFSGTEDKATEIYYSDFLTQVRNDQVRSIKIQGNKINGILLNGQSFFVYTNYNEKLVNELQNKGIIIEVEKSESIPWYISFLVHWGPLLFLIGVWIFILKRVPKGANKIFSVGKSIAKKNDKTRVNITFTDVAGCNEIKEEIKEIVEFLKDHTKITRLGGKIPRGVLMVGAPGTGKTLLAKAMAGEAKVPFYSAAGSEFVEMFVGVGASRVRDLFNQAKANSPCIVFIDEIDAVGRHRGAGIGGGHDEREQTLNQLLVEMDGFDINNGIIVLAATNRPDILDQALLRPGRFDRQVYIPLPDMQGRAEILEVHSKKVKLNTKVNLTNIARSTPGFSGSQLANLINEAALYAAKLDKKEISQIDLEAARDKIMMGAERKSMVMTEKIRKNTAYHEAGHAIVAVCLKNSDPVHKITIIPRGHALGLTSFLPEKDFYTVDKKKLIDRIIIFMGGRAAEEIIFSERTSGVEADIKNATDLAYKIVSQWGMNSKIGALSIHPETEGNFLAMDYHRENLISDELKSRVDQEVKLLLNDCYKKAKNILLKNKVKLNKLANLLITKETVTADEFKKLIIGKV